MRKLMRTHADNVTISSRQSSSTDNTFINELEKRNVYECNMFNKKTLVVVFTICNKLGGKKETVRCVCIV